MCIRYAYFMGENLSTQEKEQEQQPLFNIKFISLAQFLFMFAAAAAV